MKSKRAREAAVSAGEEDDVVGAVEERPAKKRKSNGNIESDKVKKHKKDKKETKEEEKEKKVKKDKKDKKKDKKASRKEKKEERKNLQDLPEEDAEPEVEAEQPPAVEGKARKEKREKKKDDRYGEEVIEESKGGEQSEKKDKTKAKTKDKTKDQAKNKTKDKTKNKTKDKTETEKNGNGDDESKKAEEEDVEKEEKEVTKGKKTKKDKRSSKADDATPAAAETDADAAGADKADRHIVFVGNLPFSATAESITAHFSALAPVSVRCLTKPDDARSCRGIAFVEFASAAAQRSCLDHMHHSLFDDGSGKPARKINVELTAGGGGATKHRTDKIREKNRKLDENRAKRIDKEKAAKKAAGDKQPQPQQQNMGDSIHPSRLARNPGLGH